MKENYWTIVCIIRQLIHWTNNEETNKKTENQQNLLTKWLHYQTIH